MSVHTSRSKIVAEFGYSLCKYVRPTISSCRSYACAVMRAMKGVLNIGGRETRKQAPSQDGNHSGRNAKTTLRQTD